MIITRHAGQAPATIKHKSPPDTLVETVHLCQSCTDKAGEIHRHYGKPRQRSGSCNIRFIATVDGEQVGPPRTNLVDAEYDIADHYGVPVYVDSVVDAAATAIAQQTEQPTNPKRRNTMNAQIISILYRTEDCTGRVGRVVRRHDAFVAYCKGRQLDKFETSDDAEQAVATAVGDYLYAVDHHATH